MKIVVIGGTGLIGSKLVDSLRADGHEVLPASPNTGVNSITGEGLDDALKGASVVVDVSNSPSFEDSAVLEFFRTSTGNLVAAEAAAGVGHHVALSVVGSERLPASGYLRAKVAQEELIEESGIAYSIVRATQFFEFVKGIAAGATDGDTVRLPSSLLQPLAADDVVAAVARVAVAAPLNGTTEVAGPEELHLDEFVRRGLAAEKDPRKVVTDESVGYFGGHPQGRELLPGPDAHVAGTRFTDWLARQK
ncbi:SDR family oxidoreductase [Streptomyces aurantiacus]|uniref:LysR family transcriptional regulator n=1 Tax=Streptomyces aurantiacus TaxID=47760 RepID=A0A7G1PFP5_9ACTN|nr:SDR family oxidoreductase [Streptomyces aurantiacus]BCL32577.1 LysR family transcriptional regulator [Streptomyces aurantiacus]